MLRINTLRYPIDHVLGFGDAVDDVPYPLQASLFPLFLHIRPNAILVYLWRLGNVAYALSGVLGDMFLRTRIDQIDLQIFMQIKLLVLCWAVFACEDGGG